MDYENLSDTHLYFWHNAKKSVHLKFKIYVNYIYICGVDLVHV